jgi:hypothetical protein
MGPPMTFIITIITIIITIIIIAIAIASEPSIMVRRYLNGSGVCCLSDFGAVARRRS